jgi:hypothetical protein
MCKASHDNSSLCQKLFNIAKAERKAKIQPNSVTDNFRWEAKAFIVGSSGVCFHAISMSEISLLGKLTIPCSYSRIYFEGFLEGLLTYSFGQINDNVHGS